MSSEYYKKINLCKTYVGELLKEIDNSLSIDHSVCEYNIFKIIISKPIEGKSLYYLRKNILFFSNSLKTKVESAKSVVTVDHNGVVRPIFGTIIYIDIDVNFNLLQKKKIPVLLNNGEVLLIIIIIIYILYYLKNHFLCNF
jgi:hypothetical protein